jgi:hypothetical protein
MQNIGAKFPPRPLGTYSTKLAVTQYHRVKILPNELYPNLNNNRGQTSKISFKPVSKALPVLYRLS